MKKLGKYEVIDLLGSGATAEVYRARDTVLGREVALKLLRPALVTDVSAFNRFLQEAQAAAGLFHPNIATVLDTGEDEGRYFIAMRYIPGRSLDHIIQQDGPQPLDDVIKMLHQVGSALDFAHNQGFMHRDVKPANIIRSERGDYVLTDFGLVRAMMTTGLTSHTGAVLGTPAYIPPEIWLNQTATPAVDQYALACVAYEMLTGEVLFTGDTPPAVMTAHVLNGVGSLAALPTVLSEPLRKALSQKPQERFSSIAEFLEVLDKKAPFAQPTLQDGMATRPQEPIDTHKDRRASDIPGPAAEPPSHIQHGTAPAKTDAMEKLEREGKLLQTVPAEKVAATNHFQADQTGQQINPKTAELATNHQMTALPAGNSPVASVDSGSVSHAPGNASPGKPGTGARKGRISGWVYGLFGLAGLAILIICILIALPSLIKPVSDAPTPSPSATPVPVSGFHQPRTDPVKVCLVTDTGGIDDKSFNATTWAGVQEAIEVYGVDGKYVESQEFADYEKNISLFLEEDCDLIIPVGFMLADATRAAAEANPAAKFSIVDVSYDPIVPNILGQVFQTDEAAFLAGY
ncbi:MAG TPA: bifunctional serine/threonine-protein kinase/ABC transporter substrate-binding protein, partial [Anaerolineaceae bacterium]|nr:bifunctional serine/threonine-protein kinase/ABC transporter substrate-binding protein [Anaerolineaceae bacterium]